MSVEAMTGDVHVREGAWSRPVADRTDGLRRGVDPSIARERIA